MTNPIDALPPPSSPAKRIAVQRNSDGSFADNLMKKVAFRKMTPEEAALHQAEVARVKNGANEALRQRSDNHADSMWGEITVNGKLAARIGESGVISLQDRFAMTFTSDTPAGRAAEFIRKFGGSLEIVEHEDVKSKRARYSKAPL